MDLGVDGYGLILDIIHTPHLHPHFFLSVSYDALNDKSFSLLLKTVVITIKVPKSQVEEKVMPSTPSCLFSLRLVHYGDIKGYSFKVLSVILRSIYYAIKYG